MNARKAELLLVLITLIWAGTFVFIKEAVAVIPPFMFNSLRFVSASLIWLMLFGRHFRGIPRSQLLGGIMLGILHAGGFTLQTIGLQYTTVARSSFITGIAVVLVPFVYWLVEKRSITIIQWVGVLCVGIGLYIFTDPNFDAINKGDALTIGCSAFWSFYIVLLSRFTLEDSTTEHTQTWVRTARLVGLQLLTIAVVSVSGMLIFEDVSQLQFSPAVLYGLAYTSLLATVFNTAAHTHVQRLTTAVKAGLIFSLEPVFASFLGVIALGEAFGMREISGGILVIAGVLTSEVGSTFLQRFRKAS